MLAANVAAALFGALTLRGYGTDWAGVVATLLFVSGLALTVWLLSERPERKWYDGRAAAESTKTLGWQYAVGGGPFPKSGTQQDVDERFIDRLSQIVQSVKHVSFVGSGGDEITATMREMRKQDLEVRRAAYLDGRLEDQRSWYATKAKWNERRSFKWRGAMVVLQLTGAVGAVLKASGHLDFDLLGIIGAATAAAGAWLQMKEHATLAEAYAVTERDLNLVKARIHEPTNEAEWAKFVEDAEQAMSREHTLWTARRGVPATA